MPGGPGRGLSVCVLAVAVVAISTAAGGTKPSTLVNLIRSSPGLSGSSSVSTTMISPAWNCLNSSISESGSSTRRWMARRNGRAPSVGS